MPLIVQEFEANLSSGRLLLECKLSASLPAVLSLGMIRAQFQSLLEGLFSFLILPLLLKQRSNVNEGLWVVIVILPGLPVVIECVVDLSLVIVGTRKIEVALC